MLRAGLRVGVIADYSRASRIFLNVKGFSTIVLAGFLGLAPVVAQEIPNGDFFRGLEGWTLFPQGPVKAAAEVVPDGFEGKPALKIIVSEAPEASWWRLRLSSEPRIKLEAGVSYVLAFYARSEAGARSTDVGFGANREKVTRREKFKILEEWQEFLYPFTVESSTDAANLVFDNLAAPDAVYYFSNLRITKE